MGGRQSGGVCPLPGTWVPPAKLIFSEFVWDLPCASSQIVLLEVLLSFLCPRNLALSPRWIVYNFERDIAVNQILGLSGFGSHELIVNSRGIFLTLKWPASSAYPGLGRLGRQPEPLCARPASFSSVARQSPACRFWAAGLARCTQLHLCVLFCNFHRLLRFGIPVSIRAVWQMLHFFVVKNHCHATGTDF